MLLGAPACVHSWRKLVTKIGQVNDRFPYVDGRLLARLFWAVL
jgi:hypothetical protein